MASIMTKMKTLLKVRMRNYRSIMPIVYIATLKVEEYWLRTYNRPVKWASTSPYSYMIVRKNSSPIICAKDGATMIVLWYTAMLCC